MSVKDIIESWRDEEYRENLGAEASVLMPENPAGEIELTDDDLAGAGMNGAMMPISDVISLISLTFVTIVTVITA